MRRSAALVPELKLLAGLRTCSPHMMVCRLSQRLGLCPSL